MKILVVDDHVLIREALRGVLRELKGETTILEASDFRQALALIETHADVSLVLLDLNLPDREGFGALSDLRERYPAVPVVVLSGLQDRDNVLKALDLGALGFIPKTARLEVMISALELVLSGGIYIPPQILLQEMPNAEPPAPARPVRRAAVSLADLGLTERQGEVLNLMMLGKSNKAICRALGLAEPTVKNHVTAILKALQVSNRTEAVIAAGRMGLKLPYDAKSDA